MTSRHYCITFWSEPKPLNEEKIRFACYGEEICPDSGKTHWQSYVEFYSPMRISGVKKLFNDNGIHCEIRKGTRDQAREYCQKDNKFVEFGTWISGQGHRTDLQSVTDSMKSGVKLNEIILHETEIYCKYRNGLKDLNAELIRTRTKDFRQVEVILLTGPTGCGKTREAIESTDDYYKIEGENLEWFQDYNEEKTLIIDEYNNDVSVTKMLNLLDGYQLRLNVKGSHTYANWSKVFITTNLKIDELHAKAKEAHRNALFRRITVIKNYWPPDEV